MDIAALALLLARNDCVRAEISSRVRSGPVRKIVLSPRDGRYTCEFVEARKNTTRVLSARELENFLAAHVPEFKQVDLFFHTSSCHVTTVGTRWDVSWSHAAPNMSAREGHNRKKSYLFPEGEPVPFFERLGVMDTRGRVVGDKRRKFVQVNTLLEHIHDLLTHLQSLKRPVRIVDAGCGKGYLTFALAHTLNEVMGVEAHVVGVDSRDDVISSCLAVRDHLSLPNLDFRLGSIGSLGEDGGIDGLFALHACNTATDVALWKAVQHGAEVVAVAPCCQHELAPLIPVDLCPMVLRHPILAQRAAALLTDAFRCELLAACGWRVRAVEFVDPEHTPKNTLIKATRTAVRRPLAPEFVAFRERMSSGILFERLLREHGFLTA